MDKKSQLINDIINLSRLIDEMYVYHPDNPDKVVETVVEETTSEKIK
jgi:hypothetical protein